MTWQPIETAPKDGRQVFVHSHYWNYPEIMVWNEDHKAWQEIDSKGDFCDMGFEPDFWMEIPPLPPEDAI